MSEDSQWTGTMPVTARGTPLCLRGLPPGSTDPIYAIRVTLRADSVCLKPEATVGDL